MIPSPLGGFEARSNDMRVLRNKYYSPYLRGHRAKPFFHTFTNKLNTGRFLAVESKQSEVICRLDRGQLGTFY